MPCINFSLCVFEKVVTLRTMDKNMENILRELECPVCNEYIGPVMPLCANGHGTCKNCKEKCVNCPVCKASFNGARNYMLENIIHLLYFECKNKFHGCNVGGNPILLNNHITDCEFGLYECPTKEFTKCNWNGKLSNMKKHLTTKHEPLIYIGDTITTTSIIGITFHENCCFKVFRRFNTTNGWIEWAVQYIGASGKAKDFSFKVEFKRPEKLNGFDMVLSSECIPLSLGNSNVFSSTFVKTYFPLLKFCNNVVHELEVYKCEPT